MMRGAPGGARTSRRVNVLPNRAESFGDEEAHMPVRFQVEFTLGSGPWADLAPIDGENDALTLEARWISHNQAEFANKQINWSLDSPKNDWVSYAAEFPKISYTGLLSAAFRNDSLDDKEAILALHTLATYAEARQFKLIARRVERLGLSMSDYVGNVMATVTFDKAKVVHVVPSQTLWDLKEYWIASIDGRGATTAIQWAG